MNKHLGKIMLGVALVCGSTPLFAQDHHDQRNHDQRDHDQRRDDTRRSHDHRDVRHTTRVVHTTTYVQGRHEGWYRRGGSMPAHYRNSRYVVTDWRSHRLRAPPRGYRYERGDGGDFLLVAISTGIIAGIFAGR